MKSRDTVGKLSRFTSVGASFGVVAPAFKTWAPAFWDNLAASMRPHHISKVIAMNHRDCGAARIAYGAETGSPAFAGDDTTLLYALLAKAPSIMSTVFCNP
jgi:carbonic anhydrase